MIAVVRDGRTLLDCRTLTDAEAEEVAAAVAAVRAGDDGETHGGRPLAALLGSARDEGARDRRRPGGGGRPGDGPRPVDELAREVGADPDALHRMLRALASDGVFAEEEPGVFRNTEASEGLRRGTRWHDFAHLFGGVWHRALGELDAAGEPTFERIHGTDFWSWLAEHPDERAAFDRAMSGSWEWKVDRVASAEWRGDELVVDVGGGNGSLLVELLRRRPGLRGIVFDLPETMRDETALGDRIEFVAGSFFERVPPGDVYVLSTILHDWDDERAGRSCARSAPLRRTTRACSSSMPSSPPETSRTARSCSTCSCSPSSAPASATRRSGARCWRRTGSSRSASRTA